MADTPRVTVPVEPTEAMINHAVGRIGGGSTFDTDDRREIAQSVYRAMLSAAPAPEGGAAEDLREALIQADLKIRSLPGTDQSDVEFIREVLATREDDVDDDGRLFSEVPLGTAELYRDLEDGIRPVLAAREEAPAEAGERDYPAEFEAWWATYRHRNRDVADYSVKKQIAFDAFYHAALRAQPPAREDAQPVAYEIVSYETYSGAVWISPDKADEYRTKYGCVLRPLYTHPAADALRVAVEALELAAIRFDEIYEAAEVDDVAYRNEATIHGINGNADVARSEVRQALAALQAEQGAK